MRRREVIRRFAISSAAPVLGTLLAGCSQTGETTKSPTPSNTATQPTSNTATPAANTPRLPFEVPPPNKCEVANPPQPTPAQGFEPIQYPDYPTPITDTSIESFPSHAENFASRYEEAYRYNEFLATELAQDTLEISVSAEAGGWLTEETEDGYLVGVEGQLSTQTGEDQGTVVIRDDHIAAVYYLTNEVGIRGELSMVLYDVDSLRTVEVSDIMTIFCGA